MTTEDQKGKKATALNSKSAEDSETLAILRSIRGQLAEFIKLQRAQIKTLKSIDGSINILAMQKARELNPSGAEGDSTQ